MLTGKRFFASLIILILMILVAGCDDEVERHKVLTFFFDGVPPLEDPNAVDVIIADDPNSDKTVEPSQAKRIVRAHGPSRDCKLCHKKLDQSRWAAPQAVKGIPEMCFDCHGTYADPQYYVHGPVAVGQCDLCHDPHESVYDSLLLDTVPKLCYRCHDRISIESIASHEKETVSECNSCHEAHVSSKEKLLK